MKNRFLLTAVLMVSSGFAAEDLVLEDGVPRVFTGGTEDVGTIIYPAGVWGTYAEGSLTLDGTVMTASTSSWPGSYYQNGLLDLRNGASLTFSAAVWFATCSSGYVNGLITVDDSTLTFSQNLSIGGGAYHANTGSSEIRGQNNATIAFNGDVTWLGFATLRMTNGVVSSSSAANKNFKFGAVGGTYSYSDAGGITNRVELVDTDFTYGGQFQLGIQLPGTMLLSGGTFTLGNSWLIAGWGTNAETIGIPDLTASVELTDGAVATVNGGQVDIGAQLGTHGSMSLSDGSSLTAATVYVGHYGEGRLTVDATSKVKATGNFKIAVNAESESSVTLNGGTLEVKSVIGGSGASAFVSNGGTVKMLADGKIFDTVGTVTVGVAGLVIDTQNHAVTLNQSLTGGKVLFTGGGSVTFAEGVTVEDFDAAGGTKLLWAGAGETTTISVSEGQVKRTDDVVVKGNDKQVFDIAAGALLTMSGKVGIGAMEKTGGGLLTLDNPADKFFGGMTLTGGTLAFGEHAPATFGVFEIGNQTAQALTVVKADRDVTMAFPSQDFKGAFLKRGAGGLVLERNGSWINYSSPSAPVSSGDNLDHENPISFGDGTVLPTANYLPVNVTEGRLTLRGTNADGSRNNFRFQKEWAVGLPVSEALAVQPELVLENLIVDPQRINVGVHVIEGSPVTTPKLVLTNTSTTAGICVGVKSTSPTLRPSVEIRSSTVTSGQTWFNGGYQNGSEKVVSSWKIVDSQLYCSQYAVVARPAHVEFDGSTFAQDNSFGSVPFMYYSAAATTFVFANGSKFYFTSTFNIDGGAARQTWVFDDSTWHWGTASGDRTYALAHNGSPVKFVWLEMRGKGLVLEPADGETFTMAEVLHGEGGFVNRGAGTTVLRDGVIDYAGVTCAEQGTIDFDGASVTNVTLAGAGTFVNGTLTDAKVLADGTAPQLGGVTLDGKVTVVFGETVPEIGTTVDVARYSGDIANWKAKRSKDYSVALTTDGTTVKATVEEPKGLMLIFR